MKLTHLRNELKPHHQIRPKRNPVRRIEGVKIVLINIYETSKTNVKTTIREKLVTKMIDN